MSKNPNQWTEDAAESKTPPPDATDLSWREFNVHDTDNDVGDSDEEAAAASSFNLFAPTDPGDTYETISYADLLPASTSLDGSSTIITLRAHKQYENSTGTTVWKGSEVLSAYLIRHVDAMVRNRRICELGAGVGLCGIVASRLGAQSVLMTDGDTTVLDNLRHNVELNSPPAAAATAADSSAARDNNNDRKTRTIPATISCPQLIWGKESGRNFAKAHGRQDVILATDCVYITKSVRPLLETIHQLLEPKSGVFLYVNTCASQCPVEVVFNTAQEFGMNCADTWCDSNIKDDTVYVFRSRCQ